MAPEQIRGHGDDPASDFWSLGLVLYVCVEGVSPLRRATTLATLAAVLDDPVPPPVSSGPLAPVLQALLVRDPAARPDGGTLDAMLAQAESGGTAAWPDASTRTVHLEPMNPPTTVSSVPAPVPTASGTLPDPSTEVTTPRPASASGSRPRRRTRVAAVALAAVVAAAVAVTLTLTLGDPDGKTEADDKTPNAAGPSTAKAPEKAGASSPTPSPSTPASGDGRWIAQLLSEPVTSGTAKRDQRLAAVRESVPGAQFLRSDEYASLTPGYWVIYAPGPFPDGLAALTFCADHGRTTADNCFGRYVSTDAADFRLQCRPPAASPGGRCTRS